MGLDAGAVLKRSVLCPHCNEDYLFTLRVIATIQSYDATAAVAPFAFAIVRMKRYSVT
jgi:hypothetical protein